MMRAAAGGADNLWAARAVTMIHASVIGVYFASRMVRVMGVDLMEPPRAPRGWVKVKVALSSPAGVDWSMFSRLFPSHFAPGRGSW
jgi:hypothetical protein